MSFRPLDYLRAVRESDIRPCPGASTSAQKATLVWLVTYANGDTGVSWPSLKTLAAVSGISVAQLGRCIVALRDAGWISTARESRTSVTKYTLTVPATAYGAISQDATSQDEQCDSSPCDVRPLTMSSATAHGEQRSADLSADRTAEGTAEGESVALPRDPAPEPQSSKGEKPKSEKSKPKTSCPTSDASHDDVDAWCMHWGIPQPWRNSEVNKFLDYHRAKGTLLKDWGAAWRNWERRAPNFTPRQSWAEKRHELMTQPAGGGWKSGADRGRALVLQPAEDEPAWKPGKSNSESTVSRPASEPPKLAKPKADLWCPKQGPGHGYRCHCKGRIPDDSPTIAMFANGPQAPPPRPPDAPSDPLPENDAAGAEVAR